MTAFKMVGERVTSLVNYRFASCDIQNNQSINQSGKGY